MCVLSKQIEFWANRSMFVLFCGLQVDILSVSPRHAKRYPVRPSHRDELEPSWPRRLLVIFHSESLCPGSLSRRPVARAFTPRQWQQVSSASVTVYYPVLLVTWKLKALEHSLSPFRPGRRAFAAQPGPDPSPEPQPGPWLGLGLACGSWRIMTRRRLSNCCWHQWSGIILGM